MVVLDCCSLAIVCCLFVLAMFVVSWLFAVCCCVLFVFVCCVMLCAVSWLLVVAN